LKPFYERYGDPFDSFEDFLECFFQDGGQVNIKLPAWLEAQVVPMPENEEIFGDVDEMFRLPGEE
jgi:hypothetical protein